jgi:polar amino acid transport system ATP-binding protein
MENAASLSAPVLKVSGLWLSRGGQPVLRGVDLQVERGERVALMGLSGGGKTTVLRTIVALDAFDAGEIDVDGVALRPGPPPRESRLRDLRRKVGIVFQLHHLFSHLTALENVILAQVHALHVPQSLAEARARELLGSLGVLERAGALPGELSGGEAQRVAIARALATDPPLLLMDEPTASLDPARRGELGETLEGLTRAGRTLLLATHDDDFALDFATRVAILADGVVVEEGPPERVLRRPSHPATRALLQSQGKSVVSPQRKVAGGRKAPARGRFSVIKPKPKA